MPCYALTNMEAETYPLRLERFPFLSRFDGTVVSGREGVAKMIDDTKENLEAASKLGMQTALFVSWRQFRSELEAAGILP